MKILLVEDDRATAQVAARILEHLGHEVQAVATASEGVALVRSESFDVAIVDVMLPDDEGFRVVEQINQLRPQVRCILVTGHDIADGERRARRLGASFFNKPLDYRELGRMLQEPLTT